jgi:hypothetical protein
MSCGSGKMSTKRKVTIFSSVGLAIAIATYLAFITTNNPTITSAILALLSLAACPLMCAVIGGVMWFSRHSSTNNKVNSHNSHNTQIAANTKDVAPWRNQEMLQHTNRNQNENIGVLGATELPGNNNIKNRNIE